MPNMKALPLLVKYLWVMFKFFKSRSNVKYKRTDALSKFKVKVTYLQFLVPLERSGHKEHTYQI